MTKEQRNIRLGSIIREKRERVGINCKTLGEKIGKSRQVMSDIELGRRPLSKQVAQELADALEMNKRERKSFLLAKWLLDAPQELYQEIVR